MATARGYFPSGRSPSVMRSILWLGLGDAVSFIWENMHADGDRLISRFFPKKAMRGEKRKPHEMPVHPKVEAYLQELKTATRKPRLALFPTVALLRHGGCNGLSSQFQKIMSRAGVASREHDRDRKGLGWSFHNLTFRSLRHTFISSLANAGVPKKIRMKPSGHTSETHQRYTHHEMASLRSSLSLDKGD